MLTIARKHTGYRPAVAGGLLLLAVACALIGAGCGSGDATEPQLRADLVTIDDMSVFGALERPAVVFPHDLHTRTLVSFNRSCEACHLRDSVQNLSFKFLRFTDDDKETVMEIYHDSCIGCHQTIRRETGGAEYGNMPLACGECHKRVPDYSSSMRPAGFDNSLHYRHIALAGDDCGACHHDFERGMESSCRDCHGQTARADTMSMRLASHQSCVRCHQREVSASTDCASCHSMERQLAVTVMETVPRLNRNQPDFVFLSAPADEMASSKLSTVPFSHVGHERFNSTCRVCHHQSLLACSKCHTMQGAAAGGGVSLQRAMHDMNSTRSCVGCHEISKSESRCSGCHSLMEQGRLSEHACNICHAGPSPGRLEQERARYTSLDDFRRSPRDAALSFAAADLPALVTIGLLSEEYEPVSFQHKLHVDALMNKIRGSRIASYFHGHEDVVCQGCHHHSPIGKLPPLCESCHGKPFDESKLFVPGLYGAYHRQCIGCHDKMGIGKATDCESCHRKKGSLTDIARSSQELRSYR